jgi:diguanylate cyclase (GGDEF)-like protein/PAS domain S-box-containing protein
VAHDDELSSQYLAQLMLLQNMVALLPQHNLKEVVIQGLNDFPGVDSVNWKNETGSFEKQNVIQLPLKYGKSDFGCLQLFTSEPDKLHLYIPYLQNFSSMMAVILEIKRKEEDATTVQERFFELAPDLLCIANNQGYFTKLSISWEKTLGWSREELCAVPFQQFVHPEDLSNTASTLETLIDGKQVMGFINRYKHKDGSYRWLEWACFPEEGKDLFGTARDITNAHAVAQEQRLAASVYNNTNDAIFVFNQKGEILSVNLAFTQITGFSFQKAVGANVTILSQKVTHSPNHFQNIIIDLAQSHAWEGETWCRHQSERSFLTYSNITLVQNESNENTLRFVCVMRDITEQKEDEQRINQLAYHDPLTGLANRTLLKNRLAHSISIAERDQHQMAVLFIDLDNFKAINDALGHDTGDRVLEVQADRLVSCVRKSDTVARMGGDEFVIFIDAVQNNNTITDLAKKVIAELSQPIKIKHHLLQITSSIGISIFPNDGIDTVTLMKSADTAMYTAKELGKNTFRYFSAAMMIKVDERLKLEIDLRKAIAENQFEMYYQPRICLANKKISGAEALIRWNHPEKGLISPIHFIPFAEECGLINDIGKKIICLVIKQIALWQHRLDNDFPIAINISALQFNEGNIVDLILQTCLNHSVATNTLEIEVTESVVMSNPEQAVTILKELRKLGIRIAIDDFGTGHSSLAYLKKLPLDILKIDQSFVREIHHNQDDIAIVQIIVALANVLNLVTIAEGIESPAHEQILSELNCNHAQGYYYSKPMPVEQFDDFCHALLDRSLVDI